MKAFSIMLSVVALIVASVICCGGGTGMNTGGSSSYSCSLTEYDPPYDMHPLKSGSIEVFGGVDYPKTDDVKGHSQGGILGIEARCGSYVHIRGTTGGESGLWWGRARHQRIAR